MKKHTRTIEEEYYTTDDGKEFKTCDEAIRHEEYLENEKTFKKLPRRFADGMKEWYYCSSEAEFNALLMHFRSPDTLNYLFEGDFEGPDWYFADFNPYDGVYTKPLKEEKASINSFLSAFIDVNTIVFWISGNKVTEHLSSGKLKMIPFIDVEEFVTDEVKRMNYGFKASEYVPVFADGRVAVPSVKEWKKLLSNVYGKKDVPMTLPNKIREY